MNGDIPEYLDPEREFLIEVMRVRHHHRELFSALERVRTHCPLAGNSYVWNNISSQLLNNYWSIKPQLDQLAGDLTRDVHTVGRDKNG